VAPLAAIVELWPAQMAAGVAEAVTVGKVFTVNVTVVVPVQPHVSDPVTLYVVVAVGLAVKLAPAPDGLQVYVDAPLAAMVEVCPRQMATGVAVALMPRLELILTVTVVVPVQPAAVVPVTVYTVFTVGLTVIGFIFWPVLHE